MSEKTGEVLGMSALAGTPPSEQDAELREIIWRYILEHSEPWHREHLGHLRALWDKWNAEYFAGEMVVPIMLLNVPSNPRRVGDCGSISGIGCRSQIRVRPSLLTGTHPAVRSGGEFAEGRFRFVADVLLHEMIHQWQQEVSGQDELEHYSGHGPVFRDKANEIGLRLGFPRVRNCKSRGKDKDLPSCSQWPHVVRPERFYMDALLYPSACVHTSMDKEQKDSFVSSEAKKLARRFSVDEIRAIADAAIRVREGGVA